MASDIDERPHPADAPAEFAPWVVAFFVVAALCFVGIGLLMVLTTLF